MQLVINKMVILNNKPPIFIIEFINKKLQNNENIIKFMKTLSINISFVNISNKKQHKHSIKKLRLFFIRLIKFNF